VRPIVEGTLAGFIDFRIMPDFANSTLVLQDAWANLRFSPEAQLQFGKFKSPFGLERLESATNLWFVERALPTLLAPNRDLGVMLQGALREGLAQYQVAFLNGNNDTTTTDSDVGDDKSFVARLFAPVQRRRSRRSRVGRTATTCRPQGSPATIQSIGRQPLFAFQTGVTLQGERARYSPQAYWYWGPFAMLGEYVVNSTGFQQGATTVRAHATAWQVAAAYVLTGENTSWRGVILSRLFN
jgi:phosphate-selective porin OprO/OprP